MVGFPTDVRRVILDGETGVVGAMKPGALLVDFTTTEPALAKEVRARARAHAACTERERPARVDH